MVLVFRSLPWSEEEDKQLISIVEHNDGNWTADCHAIPGRSNRACSTRWAALNRYGLPWSEEEDKKLVAAVEQQHGQPCWNLDCWNLVSSNLPGRTDGACYKRWRVIKSKYRLSLVRGGRQKIGGRC